MDETNSEMGTPGDKVMKEVGKLDELTKELKEATEYEETDREGISEWITAIGKALLAIFK